jgi:hypothetical protein
MEGLSGKVSGAVFAVLTVAATLSVPTSATAEPACATGTIPDIDRLGGSSLEIDAIDVTASTQARPLRAQYRKAVEDVVDRAYDHRAALVLLTFTAASASTKVVYAGSFDPHTGDVVLDKGAQNRARCQAYAVVDRILASGSAARDLRSTGSDIPGAMAASVELARSAIARKLAIGIRVTTDGYLAPAAAGVNRNIPNLEAELDRNTPPDRILQKFREHLLVTRLNGVDFTMVGLDHRGTRQSNTVRAVRLEAFWTLVCRRMHAKSCTVTTSFA